MLILPDLTRAALEAVPLPQDEPELRKLFFSNPEEFSRTVPLKDNGLTVLKLYLHWLPEMKAQYDALGIPPHIYEENLTDISLWCEDFTAKSHLPGIKEWRWVGKSLRLELFRLGRLQFEPTRLSEELCFAGHCWPADTPVLSVHIPAGEPLDTAAAMDSFHQAEAFFPQYFSREYPLFSCHSWLLEPSLSAILPADSRILRFQRLFHITHSSEDRQAEERVFGMLLDNPADYPEKTTLQRTLKAYLLAGNKAHATAGIRLWSE